MRHATRLSEEVCVADVPMDLGIQFITLRSIILNGSTTPDRRLPWRNELTDLRGEFNTYLEHYQSVDEQLRHKVTEFEPHKYKQLKTYLKQQTYNSNTIQYNTMICNTHKVENRTSNLGLACSWH